MRIIKTSNEATILPDCLSVYIIPRLIISLYVITIGYKTVSGSRVKPVAQLPSFRDTQPSYSFFEGDSAVLSCSIQNLGARTVVWRKATYPNPLTVGKMTYVPDDRYQVNHVPERGEWNLFIKDIQHNDSGMYECQISSKEKYIRKLIRVTVKDRPYAPRAIVIRGPQKTEKGETLVLSCNATGGKSAPANLDWIKGKRKLISDKSGRINITKHISLVTNTIISNLTIKQVVTNDAGTYECRTTDGMTSKVNIDIDVTGESPDMIKRGISQRAPATSCVSGSRVKPVAQLPSFRDTQSSYSYSEGDSAVLSCSIQNLGARTVVWRKTTYPNPLTVGKMTYVSDDRYQVHHVPERGEWNLFIKDIQHNDSGIYECQISTKEKYIRKLIRVTVKDRPYAPRAIVIRGPQKTKKGEILVLSCNATGGKSAPDDLDWIKGKRKLISDRSGRINITKHISFVTNTIISNLTIKQVVTNDAGTYECRTTDGMTSNVSIDVTGETSDMNKRRIQHAPATACGTTSTVVLYVLVFCVHCSLKYRRVIQLLTTTFHFCMMLLHSIMTGHLFRKQNTCKECRQVKSIHAHLL